MDLHSYFKSASGSHQSCCTSIDSSNSSSSSSSGSGSGCGSGSGSSSTIDSKVQGLETAVFTLN